MTETFNCHSCEKQISPTGHYITKDHHVLCFECTDTPALHSHLWPDCEETWHDPWDHIRYILATRKTTAHILEKKWIDSTNWSDVLRRTIAANRKVQA